MALITMQKGDDSVLCDDLQRATFEALGYRIADVVAESQQLVADNAKVATETGLTLMAKDGQEVLVDPTQLTHFRSQGWQEVTAVVDPIEAQSANTVDGSESNDSLKGVLGGLDPNDAELWTVDGLVKLKALEAFTGKPVNREQVDAAWPGFKRSVLQPK